MKQLIPAVVLCCIACSDSEKAAAPEAKAIVVFPIGLFFNQQIKEIDSLKLPTVKYTINGSRKDTAAITMEEFKHLAQEFLEADISQLPLKDQYKETSFADQSIPSVTLNYVTDNNQLTIRRVDVIVDPDPVADDQVKTVYIEKKETNRDTLIDKKLYWKSRNNFQVITSKRVGNQPEVISQLKVAWDNTDTF